MQELERGDSGVRSFASCRARSRCIRSTPSASDEQKRRWLPKMASGEVIGCFGLTEPDYGSNPAGMITVANGNEGRLGVERGPRCWITNGSTRAAGHRVGQDRQGRRRELDPRLHRPDEHQGLFRQGPEWQAQPACQRHQRAGAAGRVRSQRNSLLPQTGGLKSPLMCLTQARYGIAWGAVGAAMACYDEAVSYAKTRVIVRQADRRVSAAAGAARRDAQRRITKRSCSACSSGVSRIRARPHRTRCRSPSGTT